VRARALGRLDPVRTHHVDGSALVVTSRDEVSRRRAASAHVAAAVIRALSFLALGLWAGPAPAQGNFSQQPGFAHHYAAHPRRTTPATDDERMLLQRHRPRLWLPAGHVGPIDFYGDYIANGTLLSADGRVQPNPVERTLLNRLKNDPQAVFTHRPCSGCAQPRAVVFGRVDNAPVPMGNGSERQFTFLTYHVVFRHSGVPAGLAALQAWPMRLVADLDDWHQLDHYTAATVVLDESQRPLALMLQQHNALRTHLFGEAIDGQRVQWPADGRVPIDVAVRSNELFPHRAGRQERRAVRFVDADALAWLIGFGTKPWFASMDITDPAREVDYELDFLPPDDAFYSFAGYLGERRALPGRDGPPGADYNTWPTLKPLGLQLLSGYWREGDRGDFERLVPLLRSERDPSHAARAQAGEFAAALRRLGR